ncbi:hypothetical protein BS50DRAFT_622273 [Corynespora cassiicola Philippines]|uniref:Uncharacterized protein n=1 Tax=Corynespora cassiicola Philippines TaxID=1448308 RepID=A0A2T2NHJ9_CORCC|nr:hypothetical protein BS50DRAFT_622273 [Corynespora cassiicola Philippines]
MDQVAADGLSAAFGDISVGRDLTIIINPLPAVKHVTDHLPTICSTSLDVSDRLVGRLDDLKEASSNVEGYARKLQGILPRNHPELQEALRKHASILSDVETLEDSLRNYISDKGTDDRRLFVTQGIYDNIIYIRTRLLSLHLELNTIHTSNKSIDPALIREIMVQCQQSCQGQASDHEGSADDLSSYYTFYSASSIPYIERQKWREIEKAIRMRLGAEVVRDNYASVIEAVENILSLDGAITPLQNQHSALNLSQIGARRYFAVPFSLSAREFWGREEELRNTGNLLSYSDGDPKFKSLVLSGVGGIGKTATALEYAKSQAHEFNVIFWVRGENRQSIQQSFSVIASELDLGTAHHGSFQKEDINSFVLTWLSQIELSWLLVFDNVDDFDVMYEHWPKQTTHGRILITTRKEGLFLENIHREFTIEPWPNDVATQFLLRNIPQNSGIWSGERIYAPQLSTQLDCIPFACIQASKYITETHLTIKEFSEAFASAAGTTKTHPNNRPSVQHTMSAAFSHSYALLDSSSSIILGLLCFLYSNDILISIFERSNGVKIPTVLTSLHLDSNGFKSALDKLISLSLVEWETRDDSVEVHPLVVATFKENMSAPERQERLSDAMELTEYMVFQYPHLYNSFSQPGIPDVDFLQRCFHEERRADIAYTPPESYFRLNYFAQRYYEYKDNIKRSGELLETNRIVNSLLPINQEAKIRKALLDLSEGQLYIHQGKLSEGFPLLDQSRQFFDQNSVWLLQCGLASRNLANALASMSLFDRALEEHEKALDFYKDLENDTKIIETVIDIGIVHIWAGHLNQAQDCIEKALFKLRSLRRSEPRPKQTTHAFQNTWNSIIRELWRIESDYSDLETRCYLALATLRLKKIEALEDHRTQRSWLVIALKFRSLRNEHLGKAESLLRIARSFTMSSKSLKAAFFYRQGCLNYKLGKFELSIYDFREVYYLFMDSGGNHIVEEARCCFMLSKALLKDKSNPNNEQEAAKFRKEAEMLLKQHDPSAENFDNIKSYDSRIYIPWR